MKPLPAIALRRLFGPGSDDDGIAPFARALARLLAQRHIALGGDDDAADAIEAAAFAVALADDEGHACLAAERAAPWRDALLRSPVVAALGARSTREASLPLVFDGDGRLYLQRWFAYERALAHAWCARSIADPLFDDPRRARATLDRLFGSPGDTVVDWQRAAVALALLRRACVFSGGPGTGKTTTIARLIEAVLRLDANATVALAAPTGKAAARVSEAMRAHASSGAIGDDVLARWPREAVTVHKLLGIGANGALPRHAPARPLPARLVIVDEASMLGLSLAAKLFDALGTDARVVLLGDKDQLASVETGLVFAQLSRHRQFDAETMHALAALGVTVRDDTHDATHDDRSGNHRSSNDRSSNDRSPGAASTRNAVVWFERNYRFDAASGIGRLAAAVRDGDAQAALQALRSDAASADVLASSGEHLAEAIFARYESFVVAIESRAAPQALLAAFDRHRALCALRDGVANPRSAAGLDARIERLLKVRLHVAPQTQWYAGRAVMIERNDAQLGLFNGDVGIACEDERGELRVAFSSAQGALRFVHPARLPAHAGAFALTVHKAQGSEYASVDVVLPEIDTRVATRELVYTGVTRARESVRVWANEAVLRAAIGRSVVRDSGLGARLAECAAPRGGD